MVYETVIIPMLINVHINLTAAHFINIYTGGLLGALFNVLNYWLTIFRIR